MYSDNLFQHSVTQPSRKALLAALLGIAIGFTANVGAQQLTADDDTSVEGDTVENEPEEQLSVDDDANLNSDVIGSNNNVVDIDIRDYRAINYCGSPCTFDELSTGDIIRIKSHTDGYLRCKNDNFVAGKHNPTNLNKYLWKVHKTDLNNDGSDETQFENIDNTGPNGKFLTMVGGTVYCGAITGTGDTAAWVTHYKLYYTNYIYNMFGVRIKNYVHGNCIKGDSIISTSNCGTGYNQMFSFDVLASGNANL